MKKLSFILTFLLISSLIGATNDMTCSSVSATAGSQGNVEIAISNTDPFVAFQVEIPVPSGLSFVSGSVQLNPARSNGHQLSVILLPGNILRIMAYSLNNSAFSGNSGVVASFQLLAGNTPGTYSLMLNNALIGNSSSANILNSSTGGAFTVQCPDISLSASSIDFGDIPLLQTNTKYLTLTNNGNTQLNISQIEFNSPWFAHNATLPLSIPAGGSQQISITFDSQVKGNYDKNISIYSDDPDEAISMCRLIAYAFAVNEIHTGNVFAYSGNSGTLSFTINNMESFTAFQFDLHLPSSMTYIENSAQLYRNTNHLVSVNSYAEGYLRIVAYSPSNEEFSGNSGSILDLDFNINGTGGYSTISILNPLIGDVLGENILSDSYNGQLQIAAPDISCSSAMSFGQVSVTDTAIHQLTVYNYGSDTLFIEGIQSNNNVFFNEISLPVVILAGANQALPFYFHPQSEGVQTANIRLLSNDPDEYPLNITAGGTGFFPNYMSVNDVSVALCDTVRIDISVSNYEEFTGVQFELQFPDSLEFISAMSTLTARASDHVFYQSLISGNVLRCFAYSMTQSPFSGNNGVVCSLFFKTQDALPGTYDLVLSNETLGDAHSEDILYSSTDGSITLLEPSELSAASMDAPGYALQFDGVNDHVEIANSNDFNVGNNFSFECWIKANDLSTKQVIFSSANSTQSGAFEIEIGPGNAGSNCISVSSSGQYVAQTQDNVLETGKWTHLAYTRNGTGANTHAIYINGIQQTLSIDAGINFSNNTKSKLIAAGPNGNYFSGRLDEIRIWNTSRSQEQIRNTMHHILSGNETNLVAYYRFEHRVGFVLLDHCNVNNGILKNMLHSDWVESQALWKRWEGTSNSNWTTVNNWSTSFGQPGANDMVLIDAPGSEILVDALPTQAANCSSLKITGGSVVKINPGCALTVSDTIINPGGTSGLIIRSDASGTGSLIQSCKGILATVERYLSPNLYHYLSSPVLQQDISPEFMNTTSNPLPADIDLFFFDEVNNLWRNIKDQNGNLNPNFESSFIPLKGYAYAISGNAATKNFTGELISGSKQILLTRNPAAGADGWNLIGNPFPATISVNINSNATYNLLAQNSGVLDDGYEAIYLWNGMNYQAINQASESKLLSASQALFVRASAGNSHLIFHSGMQHHWNASFYKSGTQTKRLKLKLLSPGNAFSLCEIVFLDGMTKGLDPGYDARKFKTNTSVELYSVLVDDDGFDYDIQSLPLLNNQNVKIGFDAPSSGQYTFVLDQLTGFDNQPVFLEDKALNLWIAIDSTLNYPFNISQPGTYRNRFEVHFNSIITEQAENSNQSKLNIYSGNHAIIIENKFHDELTGILEVFSTDGKIILEKDIVLPPGTSKHFDLNVSTGIYPVIFHNDQMHINRKLLLR